MKVLSTVDPSQEALQTQPLGFVSLQRQLVSAASSSEGLDLHASMIWKVLAFASFEFKQHAKEKGQSTQERPTAYPYLEFFHIEKSIKGGPHGQS